VLVAIIGRRDSDEIERPLIKPIKNLKSFRQGLLGIVMSARQMRELFVILHIMLLNLSQNS
jgi:hypothetical protein